VTTSTTDFVIGGGYSMWFTEHLVGKAELDIYDNVKFQTVNAPAGTTNSSTINKLSVGIAYAF
jgi:opacity protein-like surface antigen